MFVVGLGPSVNADFLVRLAGETGGIYLQASRADQLVPAFDQIIADLSCEGTVAAVTGVVKPGEQIDQRFRVDSLLRRLNVRLLWPGSTLSLELLDPGGRPSGSTVASGPTYRIVAVGDPKPGEWTARITGQEVAPQGEAYELRAGGPSDLRLQMAPADPSDPTVLRLTSTAGTTSTVDTAWSRVTSPDGSQQDGEPPQQAPDGSWTVSVPVTGPGVYGVAAGLRGKTTTGAAWEREVTRTVVAGEGEIPWRGVVTQAEGSYLTINRGARHGMRAGLRVLLGPIGAPEGVGLIVSVLPAESTVEVQEMSGSSVAQAEMTFEVDRAEWAGDLRP